MQENSTAGDRSAQCLPTDLSWEASLLAALQDGLPQAAQGHRMLASCAKTKQNLGNVPAG